MTARGPAGSGDFILNIEDGAAVTYAFSTDVLTALNGDEHRISLTKAPRESYAFSSQLFGDTTQLLDVQNKLVINAAQGAAFLVGLMHEAVTITADGTSATVPVTSTASLDWVYAGSRVAVFNEDTGTFSKSDVVSSTGTSVTLSGSVTFKAGDALLPTMPCYLDGPPRLGLYPKNAAAFTLQAKAILIGDVSGAWSPLNATVNTYGGLPVFDQYLEVETTAGRAIAHGATIIDRGGALGTYGPRTAVAFPRQIILTLRDDSVRQWFKAFIGAVKGRTKAFYLPTWKPDFPFIGDASSGSLTFTSTGGLDFVGAWALTGMHDRVQLLKADGTIAYRQIVGYVDNGNGTQTVTLSSALSGALAMVSFLERCRFDQDAFTVTWRDAIGRCEMQAITVKQ